MAAVLTTVAMGVLAGAPVAAYLSHSEPAQWVAIANSHEVTDAASKLLQDDSSVILLIRREGELRAFNAQCPLLGAIVSWHDETQTILCRTGHGTEFDDTGKHLTGPSPGNLDRLEVREMAGRIYLKQ